MITINAADARASPLVAASLPLDDAALLEALDREIRQGIRARRLIAPDDVRGAAQRFRGKAMIRIGLRCGLRVVETTSSSTFTLRCRTRVGWTIRHCAGRAMSRWYPDGVA